MVARYNPCGAPVEIGRAPYRTRVRLYPDTEEEFELEWYPARDDVPFLRGPHGVNSLYWCRDRDEYLQTSVGEIPGTARVYNPERGKPLAIGGHVCGTPEDFAGDGVYDPEPPFVEYRPDGLPECCGALFEGTGGLVLSGTCDVDTGVTPGPTCADAASIALDTTYAMVHPGGLTDQWFVTDLTPNGTYRILLSASDPDLTVWFVWGLECFLFGTPQFTGPFSAGCGSISHFILGPHPLWVRVRGASGESAPCDYTFRIETGSCP